MEKTTLKQASLMAMRELGKILDTIDKRWRERKGLSFDKLIKWLKMHSFHGHLVVVQGNKKSDDENERLQGALKIIERNIKAGTVSIFWVRDFVSKTLRGGSSNDNNANTT